MRLVMRSFFRRLFGLRTPIMKNRAGRGTARPMFDILEDRVLLTGSNPVICNVEISEVPEANTVPWRESTDFTATFSDPYLSATPTGTVDWYYSSTFLGTTSLTSVSLGAANTTFSIQPDELDANHRFELMAV